MLFSLFYLVLGETVKEGEVRQDTAYYVLDFSYVSENTELKKMQGQSKGTLFEIWFVKN